MDFDPAGIVDTDSSNEKTARLIGCIPVRNLWLLMFYASDLYRDQGEEKVLAEEAPEDLPDLVAELLCTEVERRLQRNLSFGYQPVEKIVHRVRGRIDFLKSRRLQLEKQGKIACRFNEFTVDTPRNRFIRAVLDRLVPILKDGNKVHRCRSLSLALMRNGVSAVCPSIGEIAAIRFGKHDTVDRRMISAARLAFEMAIPTEQQGARLLPQLSRDIHWIRHLYEKAVAGFYAVALHADAWRVFAGKMLRWPTASRTDRIDEILPCMKLDIMLESSSRNERIIIDTKFNYIFTGSQHRENLLRSGYIYQMYSYLRSQETEDDLLSKCSCGLLLHPSIGETVDESAYIQGHILRFATVDLTASSKDIRRQLLEAVRFPVSFHGSR
jgi:5-methylcytosine-specific restriction enzyme subunit McrC